jgi:hypothetical protein
MRGVFLPFSVSKAIDLDATLQDLQFHAVAACRPRSASMEAFPRMPKNLQVVTIRAFFIGPIDETNGNWRTSVKFGSNPAEHFEARELIQCSIKPPTVGNRVEMSADQQRLFGFTSQRYPAVSGCVVVLLYGQFFHLWANHGVLKPQVCPATRCAPFS